MCDLQKATILFAGEGYGKKRAVRYYSEKYPEKHVENVLFPESFETGSDEKKAQDILNVITERLPLEQVLLFLRQPPSVMEMISSALNANNIVYGLALRFGKWVGPIPDRAVLIIIDDNQCVLHVVEDAISRCRERVLLNKHWSKLQELESRGWDYDRDEQKAVVLVISTALWKAYTAAPRAKAIINDTPPDGATVSLPRADIVAGTGLVRHDDVANEKSFGMNVGPHDVAVRMVESYIRTNSALLVPEHPEGTETFYMSMLDQMNVYYGVICYEHEDMGDPALDHTYWINPSNNPTNELKDVVSAERDRLHKCQSFEE